MTIPRLVYLSGEPGVGKSTLMARITAGLDRHPVRAEHDAPAREVLMEAGAAIPVAVELGTRRGAFSGTDALPQTVIHAAESYVRSPRSLEESRGLLLAEGARLANRRFLTAAVESGWHVQLLHLYGEELAAHRRLTRAESLGVPVQHAAWVKGRRTAAANLARLASHYGVEVMAVNADLLAGDPSYGDALLSTIRRSRADSTPR